MNGKPAGRRVAECVAFIPFPLLHAKVVDGNLDGGYSGLGAFYCTPTVARQRRTLTGLPPLLLLHIRVQVRHTGFVMMLPRIADRRRAVKPGERRISPKKTAQRQSFRPGVLYVSWMGRVARRASPPR